MIAHLSGKVRSKSDRAVVLSVSGTGYLVYVARSILEKIQPGEDHELHIHTHVREDDISLYGFLTHDEWQLFKLLLTVSGIGPKSALEILNAPLAKVRQAIAKKDASFLTQIPGIGRKTAERIIVDLQGKIQEALIEEAAEPMDGNNEDIVQALVSLGYHRHKVLDGLTKIPQEIKDEEAIIKYFLKNI